MYIFCVYLTSEKNKINQKKWLYNLFSFISFLKRINYSISHPNIQLLYEGKSLVLFLQFSFTFLPEALAIALAR